MRSALGTVTLSLSLTYLRYKIMRYEIELARFMRASSLTANGPILSLEKGRGLCGSVCACGMGGLDKTEHPEEKCINYLSQKRLI